MRIALVHDYLREYGGAERVVEALHEIFPQAPVYTAYFRPEGLGPHAQRLEEWDIRTSWLQKLPFANKLISPLRIFAPKIFESFDLSDYDLVISSSAIYFAKAVKVGPKTLHLAYIHTPPRYLYGYTTSYNYKKNLLIKIFGEIANHFLRLADFETSQRPNILIANSKNVAARIKKFYRRDSVVIYPPVEVEKYQVSSIKYQGKEKKYYLSLGRLVRGKGTEIIVRACTQLEVPLKVVGTGPQLQELQKIAGKNVEFLGQVKDEDLPQLLAGAKATIVASEDEDFGIVPVESMAAGTPVIAPRAGGFLETVIPGKTGEFFPSAGSGQVQVTAEALVKVLKDFSPEKYDPKDCIGQAEKFSKERFKQEILELVEKNLPS